MVSFGRRPDTVISKIFIQDMVVSGIFIQDTVIGLPNLYTRQGGQPNLYTAYNIKWYSIKINDFILQGKDESLSKNLSALEERRS